MNWRLKHRELREKSADISIDKKAVIIPFAQDHVVATFIEGVDPLFDSFLQSYLTELFNKYPDTLVGNISSLSNNEKQSLTDSLKKIGNEMLKEFNEQKKIFIGRTNVRPIIKAVGVLPKDELAIMAETLVNLTSFKQRISAEAETVGGPIDVAVISKGDGFIWIKRKHYFKPELNPSFFENYFKQIEDKMEEKNAH